jgi:hypothetical protein
LGVDSREVIIQRIGIYRFESFFNPLARPPLNRLPKGAPSAPTKPSAQNPLFQLGIRNGKRNAPRPIRPGSAYLIQRAWLVVRKITAGRSGLELGKERLQLALGFRRGLGNRGLKSLIETGNITPLFAPLDDFVSHHRFKFSPVHLNLRSQPIKNNQCAGSAQMNMAPADRQHREFGKTSTRLTTKRQTGLN